MRTKLITALRATANALEQETFDYKWAEPSRCNCGALFCALTGKSAVLLNVPNPKDGKYADWKKRVGQFCPITGIPEHELFKELFGYGLTQVDIINLEYLADPSVLARINLPIRVSKKKWWQRQTVQTNYTEKVDYTNKEHVIAYMRAWADLLTEKGQMDGTRNNQPTVEQQLA